MCVLVCVCVCVWCVNVGGIDFITRKARNVYGVVAFKVDIYTVNIAVFCQQVGGEEIRGVLAVRVRLR